VSRVVLVTARWGESHGESGAVARLLAGALSTRAQLEVISLRTSASRSPGARIRTLHDSVFVVHEVAASPSERARAGLVRAALAQGGGGRISEIVGPRLVELGGGRAPGVAEQIASLRADSVVLAGPETWWLPEALRSLRAGTRLVSLPLLGDDPAYDLGAYRALLTQVDALGVLSRAESRRVATRLGAVGGPGRPQLPEVTELDVAFPVNRPDSESQMVGMSHFGRFVVLMTGFQSGSPTAARTPGHDYVRRELGAVAVAEVARDRWFVSDRHEVREVPIGPSRPNLWKLLRHAEVCLDLRAQGITGRETLESLILGTPVVVPEGTVAAEHAERSGGGLCYRDYRELFDAAKAILDNAPLRAGMSAKGREWAEAVHGDQGRFCEQAARLVLG